MAKDEKKKKSKNVKESKSNFVKESRAELKKVIWPTPKSLVNDTATVIGIVLIVAVIVVILDFIFLNVSENVIIKAEEKVKNTNSVVTELNTDDAENNQENAENGEASQENIENTESTENTDNGNSETEQNAE